jgi:gamma-carbonic anhydrase
MNLRNIKYNGITPNIAKDAYIADNAVISGDVTISSGANIWYGCVMRGDLAPIKIGKGTNVQDNTVIHVSRPNHPNNKSGPEGGPTIIGDGVTIGHNTTLHACILEDFSFIGMHAVILDMAIVQSGAMVAAGSVVTPGKIIKAGEIWGGNPAKFLRNLTKSESDYIKQSELNYIKLAKEYFSI